MTALSALQMEPHDTGRAWIEINREALRQNVEALRALLPPRCELMVVVKANAYGHGALPVARELNRLGVRAFGVATIAEAVELRKGGICGELLILGYTPPEDFPLLAAWDLTQSVISCEYAKLLNRFGGKINVHLCIDTGMHRCGERCENIRQIQSVFHMQHLRVTGLFSHLCTADTMKPEDQAYARAQGQAFWQTLHRLEADGCRCGKKHLLASYGVLNYPEFGGDYARIGIALYGLQSRQSDSPRHALPLRPVLSLKARVAMLKKLHAGEGAGYCLHDIASSERTIAVVTIGYADGLPRCLSDARGSVLIRGKRAPIVGLICMDQTLVDVTDIPETCCGDPVTLIGESGSQRITAYELSDLAHTITNELLSRMGSRLPRIVV